MRPSGIYPILYAFFNAAGGLDRDAMRLQVRACLAGGAHGVAVLGLATEVSKLSPVERRRVIEWAAEDLAGRVPLAVTVFGRSPAEQIEAMRHAEGAGAAWVILQPPPQPGMAEAELMRFMAPVLDAARISAGLQNAPDLMGLGLSPENLARMAAAHPALQVLKAEGPATTVADLVDRTGGRLAVLNGRGGLELPDNLRAGAAGMIPAPDCFDVQVRIWKAMAAGDEAEAERLYAAILPSIVFAMQGVGHLVCYGKRLVAARLGLGPVHDRAPAVLPTPFGMPAWSGSRRRWGHTRRCRVDKRVAATGRRRRGRKRCASPLNHHCEPITEQHGTPPAALSQAASHSEGGSSCNPLANTSPGPR